MLDRFINRWTISAFALLVIIGVAAGIIASRYNPAPPLVITFTTPVATRGSIYVDGLVAAPGWYKLHSGDTIDDLLAAAGAASGNITLTVGPVTGEQKVNINTAGAWLLQALPGIGQGRAEAIVAYRQANGPFHDVEELVKVEGIGPGLLEDIRDLVTAGE